MSRGSGNILNADLTQTFPNALQYDERMVAWAKVMAGALQNIAAGDRDVGIYYRLNELDEFMLDILAGELHIDWYDFTYDIETKREVIANSVKVHKMLGTRAAVDTVLHAIFQEDFELEEWWQYNGKPYTFRINVDVSERGLKAEEHKAAVRSITLTKNLRSHLEGMNYQADYTPGALYAGAWSGIVNRVEIWPELACSIETRAAARIGGPGAAGKQRLEIWPETVSSIEASTGVQMPAKLTGRQRVEIY